MKTLGFAMALALTGSTVEAATLFEVPINGGIARFQLDDNCEQAVCASISWTENGRRHDRQNRKELSHKETAKRSPRAKSEPVAKLSPSDSAPVLGSTAKPSIDEVPPSAPVLSGTGKPSVDEVPPSAPAQTPAHEDLAISGSGAEPTATANRASDAGVALADPVLEPGNAAPVAPPKPAVSANKDPAVSPVGEWLVEDGEARIRIEECANNLCGVVSGAKNANETDRKNPKAELRNRPIIGVLVLLDMKPAAVNRWEGRIYNAKNGQTYTAHISLIDPERLRVEGCVFGGFFCGGQTWTRVN